MMTDALLQLSSAQTVTASAVSTNTIDLGSNQPRDIGGRLGLYAVFTVDQTVTAAGAATVNFQVVTSANADLSSANVLVQTDAIGKSELTAGRRPIAMQIPESVLTSLPIGQRYLGVQYTVGTGPLTAGKFSAVITDSPVSTGKYYASGFTVA